MMKAILTKLLKRIFCDLLKQHNYTYQSSSVYNKQNKKWERDLKIICKICNKELI
jgi:hypothetical protein